MLSLVFPRLNCLSVATGPATASKHCLGRRLLGTASLILLLGYTASAQNAPTPASIPTGDRVLYGRHAKLLRETRAQPGDRVLYSRHAKLLRKTRAQPHAQGSYLSRHELRLKRHQYVDQHRDEFPAIYQPGVE